MRIARAAATIQAQRAERIAVLDAQLDRPAPPTGRIAGRYLPVRDIQHTSDKLGRIQSLQPLIRSGMLQFSRRHATLLEQLRLFPKAAHDDGPDALEMAVQVGRACGRGPTAEEWMECIRLNKEHARRRSESSGGFW